MAIKIVLPENEGMKTGVSTKVYTESGEEIKNITGINIAVGINEIITATITVAVSEVENLNCIDTEISQGTIETMKALGYKIAKDDNN